MALRPYNTCVKHYTDIEIYVSEGTAFITPTVICQECEIIGLTKRSTLTFGKHVKLIMLCEITSVSCQNCKMVDFTKNLLYI